jgi:NAD(P)H-dependent FMN reductase
MFVVISGTNRPDSRTRRVSRLVEKELLEAKQQVTLLDLAELPADLFAPSSYATKPAAFSPYQEALLEADGILTVVPEYNGSFPGVLKYFIDMLRFPESLVDKPAGFVGLSAGRWGALRAVEQLELVFQYRCAHLYGHRLFLPGIGTLLDDEGCLTGPDYVERLRRTVVGFIDFSHRVGGVGG